MSFERPLPTVTVKVPGPHTGYSGININPPPPEPPALPGADPPPAPTTNTSIAGIPAGTVNVPDDVNVSLTGMCVLVILNALELVFEAASTALKTKLNVVVELTCGKVPENTAEPPSAAVLANVIPPGKAPDCNSKVTLPADSGSVAFTVAENDVPSLPVPNVPEAVTKTGDASTFI
jgi:hypothetical protein